MSSSNEYMRIYMAAKYHRRRASAIAQLGGQCVDCGAKDQLEFDHKDAATKEREIGPMFGGASESRLQAELLLCELRCRPCHVAKSLAKAEMPIVEHGGGLQGKRHCRCRPCLDRKNARRRELKMLRKVAKDDHTLAA